LPDRDPKIQAPKAPSDNGFVTALDPRFGHWLLSSLRSGLLAIDATGQLLEINPDAARVVFGCGSAAADDLTEHLIGKHCRDALAGQPAMAELMLSALDGREPPSRAELRLEANGGAAPASIGYTLTRVRDEEGRVRGAVMQFRDLTPYERADEQERLRERLLALGQMAAGVAHELRNPLASTEILVGLLAREVREEEPAALVDDLRSELRRMAAIIDASLSFVRTEAPRWELEDPRALIASVVAGARARSPEGVEINSEVGGSPAQVAMDREKLESVLVNLVQNACHALLEDPDSAAPTVTISCDVEGNAQAELVIRVADNGPGVPEALRERIFYPFFTTRESGSGVGLALAQKLVAAHGGSLLLERQRVGACFAIHLPIRTDLRGELAADDEATR
jgi:signal transduction histidine kinase